MLTPLRIGHLLLAASAAVASAAPLRIDINAEKRADMLSEGWVNWLPQGSSPTIEEGGVSVTLRAAGGSSLKTDGDKSLVARGLTVGADGVFASGGETPAIEVEISGLEAGTHSFVGYHHPLSDDLAPAVHTVSIGDHEVRSSGPGREPRHDDELATSYLEFEAEEGRPVVLRIECPERAALNAIAIDIGDPRRKALMPGPADLERHADGDDGTVTLSWTPAASAVRHHLHVASARSAEDAIGQLASSERSASTSESSHTLPVARDSLLHYAWRVDSEDREGVVTRGDAWTFRVRHPAFPTAEGYGRFAIGGRGGRVIHVTNLNDSGPGSFRAAVEATGPRTVVFDVSGLIALESKLVFRKENEFLTIAGQTAPGKGICLRNYTFGGLGGRDTIVRYLRVRLGDTTGRTMDGMGLAGSDHCIVDHCSISWSIDEAFSSRGAKNITFQRSLISEALNVAGHRKYGENSGHGFAGSISGNVGSFHHSLLAHNAGRNWSLAGATDQANRHAGRLDIRNMVVYNWHHRTTDGGAREVNFVNNYYKPGPATRILSYLNPQFENPAFGPQQYFVAGNIMEGVCGPEGPEGPFEGVRPRGKQDAPVTVPRPFFEPFVRTDTAKEGYENVLADVGCNVPVLDDHDTRVIRETRTGTASYRGSRSGLPGIPDSQADVGGWEDYPEVRRAADWDRDRDGMPDAWERQKGLDPDDGGDGALDPDGDGYTNLEEYLNSLVAARP